MKLLLIGATGQLGSDLIRNNVGHQIVAPGRSELDITSSETIAGAVRDTSPDWVINTAAFHNVPLCEEQPEQAFRTNCVAVRDLAQACSAHGARLMTFSTDYVFNGKSKAAYNECDCPAPLQIYGMTKLAGENAAQAIAPEHAVIVRTCGLYGQSGAISKGGNFVDKRVVEARRGIEQEMSSDQTVCPTSTYELRVKQGCLRFGRTPCNHVGRLPPRKSRRVHLVRICQDDLRVYRN
jgi:dTDP-4-dehydrorhamnose reductase